jgi:hypothetical protein
MGVSGLPVPASSRHIIANSSLTRRLVTLRLAIRAYIAIRYEAKSVPDPTETLITMMRDFVTSRGATFLVGLTRGEAGLEAFLAAQGIRYVAFDDAERFPDWGSHWNPAGHASVAASILDLLRKERVVPVTAASDPILPG